MRNNKFNFDLNESVFNKVKKTKGSDIDAKTDRLLKPITGRQEIVRVINKLCDEDFYNDSKWIDVDRNSSFFKNFGIESIGYTICFRYSERSVAMPWIIFVNDEHDVFLNKYYPNDNLTSQMEIKYNRWTDEIKLAIGEYLRDEISNISESVFNKVKKTSVSDISKNIDNEMSNNGIWLEKLEYLIKRYGGTFNCGGRLSEGESIGEELFFETFLPMVTDSKFKGSTVEEIEWNIFMSLKPVTYYVKELDETYYLYYTSYSKSEGFCENFYWCTEKEFGNQEYWNPDYVIEEGQTSLMEIYNFFKRYVDLKAKYTDDIRYKNLVNESVFNKVKKANTTDIEKNVDKGIRLDYYKESLKKQDIFQNIKELFEDQWRRVEWTDDPGCPGEWFPIWLEESKEWQDVFDNDHQNTLVQFCYGDGWEPDEDWRETELNPPLKQIWILEYYTTNSRGDCDNSDYVLSDFDKDEQIEFYLCLKKTFGLDFWYEPNSSVNESESVKDDHNVEPQPNEIKPKKKPFFDNRNSDGQECVETGDYDVNVYLKDCPFFMGKEQVSFFKMVQDAKEKHTVKDPDDFINKARMNESCLFESMELNEYGQINYELNFDEDEYQEYLADEELQDTQENKIEYIKDNCEFELEFLDNETFHTINTDYFYYSQMVDELGERMADYILNDCLKSGKGCIEICSWYDEEELDLNNDSQVNERARKVLSHGRFFEGCRGFILTDGTVVYTPTEHNECTKINGVKGTYDFIRMGNIRILDKSVDIGKYPTNEQKLVLRKIVQCYSPLYLDFISNGTEMSKVYDRPNFELVMRDINNFFGVKETEYIDEKSFFESLEYQLYRNEKRKPLNESVFKKVKKVKSNNIEDKVDSEVFNYKEMIIKGIENKEFKSVEDCGDIVYIYYLKGGEPVFDKKDMIFSAGGVGEFTRDGEIFKLVYYPEYDELDVVYAPKNLEQAFGDEEEWYDEWEDLEIPFEEFTPYEQKAIYDDIPKIG